MQTTPFETGTANILEMVVHYFVFWIVLKFLNRYLINLKARKLQKVMLIGWMWCTCLAYFCILASMKQTHHKYKVLYYDSNLYLLGLGINHQKIAQKYRCLCVRYFLHLVSVSDILLRVSWSYLHMASTFFQHILSKKKAKDRIFNQRLGLALIVQTI